MKKPQIPPSMHQLLGEAGKDAARMGSILERMQREDLDADYLHWDDLRRRPPPGGVDHRGWWLATKLSRKGKGIALRDLKGIAFRYSIPEVVIAELQQIDMGSAGLVGVPEPITNPHTRDRYLVSSLMEEAITSSQLEGALTTREVAKEMLRAGRPPRDQSERMILNNFRTMQHIRTLKDEPLTPERVFEIHALVTENAMEDPSACGRLRRSDEQVVVGDDYGEIFHEPPPAGELQARLEKMCHFANEQESLLHPVIRAIFLHFWLAYDHPFVDGNGRTARALFYWSMLRRGYWLFEFVSISSALRRAPVAYGRSFLHTETDDNDLTYFLIAQTKVIRSAIEDLHRYIARKTEETAELEKRMRALELFNHRQVELIRHALRHPGKRYTIASHRTSHGVAYQTARTDLQDLAARGVLKQRTRGKSLVYSAAPNLSKILSDLEEVGR